MLFKPTKIINVNLFGEIRNDNNESFYGWHLVPCEAMLIKQTVLPNHELYVVKIQNGFRLVEFTTGITLGGAYPEPTATKAKKWLHDRIVQYGITKIEEAITETLNVRGYANKPT